MPCVLKATPLTAALVAVLSLSPLVALAQEAPTEEADVESGAPGPTATDDGTLADEPTADPAETAEGAEGQTGLGEGAVGSEEPAPQGRLIETAADEDDSEVDGPTTDTDEEDTEEVGNRARLAATLESTEAAAADIRAAAERLPAIVDRIDALVGELEELPIEELVGELTSLASSANSLVSSESTQALPADLSATLTEVQALLRDLREGGLIDNANATLLSTRTAANSLPALAERAGVLLDQAGVTIEGFQGSGSILREVERTLREVADAADAVSSLARAIERDPNSLLFGR